MSSRRAAYMPVTLAASAGIAPASFSSSGCSSPRRLTVSLPHWKPRAAPPLMRIPPLSPSISIRNVVDSGSWAPATSTAQRSPGAEANLRKHVVGCRSRLFRFRVADRNQRVLRRQAGQVDQRSENSSSEIQRVGTLNRQQRDTTPSLFGKAHCRLNLRTKCLGA